ncbi:hypothetical protein L226DRAFT_519947 [Lentinus tigrinus ALCF2SS1-7]|uniref:Uncharacterized protein n=1 Tax=Lentinus tigrinus ALCF2SS1-6 TaxID=1328759 RepID=A0A5C2SRZ3_9APHY|nr:hypothetical protein L227DRAFT_627365 [Lentinus tigrinus ALCF2SS1-6]RPD80574.1 hypothetical protein L226DRAFT_519947 [Lentinus tigrinus ALCF2SS1-7]
MYILHSSCNATTSYSPRRLNEGMFMVWKLAWSNDNSRLASANADKTVIVWNTEHRSGYRPIATLSGYKEAVQAETCVVEVDEHEASVLGVAWLPDGSGFVSGVLDRKINANGDSTDSWTLSWMHITDLAISPDAPGDKEIKTRYDITGDCGCFQLSQDPIYLLFTLEEPDTVAE